MEFKAQIEKLEGATNWTKWKRQVELLLMHHEVHDLVIGVHAAFQVDADDKGRKEHKQKIKIFKKADALAQLILVGSMNDANVELTPTCRTSNET
ncbi:hypothetical protein ILUMI_10957 [Ignelater luminosus]|uniref:Uncharacterized protein n=1 Tax=Ignelater luminosus TaxID=2038154 RepID=A0A8K0GDP1_IGNLU|nr:hypothetical protein ILUMI_10957 [Ignelater luminosus]